MTKKHLVTVRNDYHNTSATVRVSDGEAIEGPRLRRVWRALCGMPDCCCSSIDCMGMRGDQDPDWYFADAYDTRTGNPRLIAQHVKGIDPER